VSLPRGSPLGPRQYPQVACKEVQYAHGIPALEDKLVQLACARLLSAIYEQDFLACSYGYRPGRGALDAVEDLTFDLQYGSYGYVVEADVCGFFDHLGHSELEGMLRERIDDGAFMGLIR
jgi:RNA-directed DNA polymerase